MKDLSLAQMESLGINKWMSDKEIEKAISKALEAQQQVLDTPVKDVKQSERTLDDVLVNGGDYTLKFNGKKVKIRVLTPSDMQLRDNAGSYSEQGIEYDVKAPYRFHCYNSHNNLVSVSCKTYVEAEEVIAEIYEKGLYRISSSKL